MIIGIAILNQIVYVRHDVHILVMIYLSIINKFECYVEVENFGNFSEEVNGKALKAIVAREFFGLKQDTYFVSP